MAILFLNVHPPKPKLTVFHDGNCFLIPSMVRAYSLGFVLLRVVAYGTSWSLSNALYDDCCYRFDIPFQVLSAETNPNMT
jgi:hypothetical protein